jgi:SAM-dependent methyltransferase
MVKKWLRPIVRRVLPRAARRRIVELTRWPPVGHVRFGELRRLEPISRVWGVDRGWPVDRYYIEGFLAENARDIHGRVLEIGNFGYAGKFGAGNARETATVRVEDGHGIDAAVRELDDATAFAPESFDCVILTQTLQYVYDVRAFISVVYRLLKPDGVVLATVPGIGKISRYDMDRWGQYWSFTSLAARRLFEAAFNPAAVEVASHGNVLTAIAFLQGLAWQDLHKEELHYHDPDYELVVTVRASKLAVVQ